MDIYFQDGGDHARVNFSNFKVTPGISEIVCNYSLSNEKFSDTTSSGASEGFSKGTILSQQMIATLKAPSTSAGTVSGYVEFGVQSTGGWLASHHHIIFTDCTGKVTQ